MQTKWQEKKMKEMMYKVRETFVKRGASLMSTLIKREKKGKKKRKKKWRHISRKNSSRLE
jgi:hypothetical protein